VLTARIFSDSIVDLSADILDAPSAGSPGELSLCGCEICLTCFLLLLGFRVIRVLDSVRDEGEALVAAGSSRSMIKL